MVLAKDLLGVTLAVRSHPEASVETELPTSFATRWSARDEKLDEETKNYD
jgi:hypothetical protein